MHTFGTSGHNFGNTDWNEMEITEIVNSKYASFMKTYNEGVSRYVPKYEEVIEEINE